MYLQVSKGVFRIPKLLLCNGEILATVDQGEERRVWTRFWFDTTAATPERLTYCSRICNIPSSNFIPKLNPLTKQSTDCLHGYRSTITREKRKNYMYMTTIRYAADISAIPGYSIWSNFHWPTNTSLTNQHQPKHRNIGRWGWEILISSRSGCYFLRSTLKEAPCNQFQTLI